MYKSIPLIKSHPQIRKAIIHRMTELDLYQRDVIKDAKDRGVIIQSSTFSRYLKNGYTNGSLKEDQILWLCVRYDIEIKINIGVPVIQPDQTLKYIIPAYNEQKALTKLNLMFPQNGK